MPKRTNPGSWPGIDDPKAVDEAFKLLLGTTLVMLTIYLVTSVASERMPRYAPWLAVPGTLSFLFGHATGGLAIVASARFRTLMRMSGTVAYDRIVVRIMYAVGALAATLGAIGTIVMCTAIVML